MEEGRSRGRGDYYIQQGGEAIRLFSIKKKRVSDGPTEGSVVLHKDHLHRDHLASGSDQWLPPPYGGYEEWIKKKIFLPCTVTLNQTKISCQGGDCFQVIVQWEETGSSSSFPLP